MQSNTELERFAYIASHDMLEPIRMITNFGNMISREYGPTLDDTGKEYLHLVVNAGKLLKDLIDDLLSYSRLGYEHTQMLNFDGENVLTGMMENLKGLIEERGAAITHDAFPTIYGNPVQILRLIQNLVVNAIKYQPKGNPPHIHIGIQELADEWQVSVKDNGMGIKEDYQVQIFQPFRRLHSWDSIQGTGLGLSICKKIVENHAGRIWVTSAIGKGSCFSFAIKKPVVRREEIHDRKLAV